MTLLLNRLSRQVIEATKALETPWLQGIRVFSVSGQIAVDEPRSPISPLLGKNKCTSGERVRDLYAQLAKLPLINVFPRRKRIASPLAKGSR